MYFDDIADDYHSVVGTWELNADDITEFAKTWDPRAVHTDPDAAEQSPFGTLIASSAHLFAIVTLLFARHDDQIQIVAMLGKDKLRLPSPARANTTLTYETRCTGKRASASRPVNGHRESRRHRYRQFGQRGTHPGSHADGGAPTMTRTPGPAPSAHAAEIHAAIQQLLLAHGCYSPVELLLTTNRLDYDDYQAWRGGSQRTLDPVLRDGVATARSFLEEADLWARGLDLKAQPIALLGTEAQAGLEIRRRPSADSTNCCTPSTDATLTWRSPICFSTVPKRTSKPTSGRRSRPRRRPGRRNAPRPCRP